MGEGYSVAVLGATGAVGRRIIEQLEQSTIPVAEIKLLASARSAGETLRFKEQDVVVEEATPTSFEGVDLVLASAGGTVSKNLAPEAVKRGAVVVDNSSFWRMHDDVPLVVPEVNEDALADHHGIIANPNCSTIQMVVALEPIRQRFGLQQVVVSTYQAASGAGQRALDEVAAEHAANLQGATVPAQVLPVKSEPKHYQLADNLLPQIDVFEDDNYTHEEWKMIRETKKIMLGDKNSPDIKVTATTVRVPVPIGHGETVYIATDAPEATAAEIRQSLVGAPGVVVEDDPANQIYPQPINAVGKRETFVGRIRRDVENPGNFHLWVVADNLVKGAAWNTVEIAERLVARDLVRVPENNVIPAP